MLLSVEASLRRAEPEGKKRLKRKNLKLNLPLKLRRRGSTVKSLIQTWNKVLSLQQITSMNYEKQTD
jgi:hypothetical protein